MPILKSRFALPLLLIFGASLNTNAQAKSGRLEAVLSQMNAASAKFTSAQADLRQELFTKIVQDTQTQTGQIYVLRKSGNTQMGMKMFPAEAKPGAQPIQVVEFKDGKLRVLNTSTKQIEQFTTSGKNQGVAETVMTLGVGGSGTDLAKAWNITDQGTEKISDGGNQVEVEKLDLVSKDEGIRKNYSRITVWIDPARGVSLKQLFYDASGGTPTGDTRTVYYSNIRLNQNVPVNQFAINCKGCNVVQH